MIVRLMGEGQYTVSDELASELNQLDQAAAEAIEAGDEHQLRECLEAIGTMVRQRGERLHDGHLSPSEVIIPPADLQLDEAQELFAGEGLIPDLPVRR